jgi:hypothetical protein
MNDEIGNLFLRCEIIRHVKMNDQMCCLCEVELGKAFEHTILKTIRKEDVKNKFEH